MELLFIKIILGIILLWLIWDKVFKKETSQTIDTSELKHLEQENFKLTKEILKHEKEADLREEKLSQKLEKLEKAQHQLELERKRVIAQDEAKIQVEFETKNRIWNDHENQVIHKLAQLCQKPEIGFSYFENTNLPQGFEAKLKPDFMISFLGQYIVFDAKKSKDLNTYIPEQVKKTAQKYKDNSDIYSTIFFVIPTTDIGELKKLSFEEGKFTFLMINTESVEAILKSFKKVTEYEKLEKLDPQERSKIVNLIAHYDRHIAFQNAANILLAKESIPLMDSKSELSDDLQEAIQNKKQQLRDLKLKQAELTDITKNIKNIKKLDYF